MGWETCSVTAQSVAAAIFTSETLLLFHQCMPAVLARRGIATGQHHEAKIQAVSAQWRASRR